MIYSKTLDGLIRVKKYFFQKFFCGSVIFLIHIMGICCGPFDFFCLGGQYYGLGHPTVEFHALVVLNHSCYVVLGLNWP